MAYTIIIRLENHSKDLLKLGTSGVAELEITGFFTQSLTKNGQS